MPTADITTDETSAVKPIILARSQALPAVLLSTHPILVHDMTTKQYTLVLFAGAIDGTFHVFTFNGLTPEMFSTEDSALLSAPRPTVLPGTFNLQNTAKFTTMIQSAQFTLELASSCKPQEKFLTKIITQQDTFIISPSTPKPTAFRVATSSHDQTIAFIDVLFNTPEQIEALVQKTIEFKGKVESICLLPTPTVFHDQSHPVLQNPSLVPTTALSRYFTSTVRKLYKGNYLDNVEFIAPSIPYSRTMTNTDDNNDNNNDGIIPANLFAASIRNDAHLQIIDIVKMEIVDKLNVNITGDDHVSFTVLDMVFDAYYGLLYLATDTHTIVIMDTLTKQHIRRLYCTDNHELATPILRLIPIPSFNLSPSTTTTPTITNDTPQLLINQAPYRNLVAVTTSNNSIKIYNQHNQQQIVEFNTNKKNIKGFVVIPTAHPTEPFSFITTGFDKTFAVFF